MRFPGTYTFLDLNLRKDYHTDETIVESLERADILKVNDEELSFLVDLSDIRSASLPEKVDSLIDRRRLRYCVVTLGPKGAFAASSSGEKAYHPGYRVATVDTCGAGDGFSAGFIHMLFRKRSSRPSLRGSAMRSARWSLDKRERRSRFHSKTFRPSWKRGLWGRSTPCSKPFSLETLY